LKSVTRLIEKQLRLKVNEDKSGTKEVKEVKFLGFSFYRKEGQIRIRIADKVKQRIKSKLRMLTKRNLGRSIDYVIKEINKYGDGMKIYFQIADGYGYFRNTDGWLRRRIRMYIWKQWKTTKSRYRNLRSLGATRRDAYMHANTRKGCWRVAYSWILTKTLTNKYIKELGLRDLSNSQLQLQLI